MALGKRNHEQQEAWVATTDLPRSPGHPFYRKLNRLLAEAGFDAWLETVCLPYYADQKGRPSIPPGTYFRMILIGYFEGIASQRGIAWRCCDSRSLAEFLGYGPTDETPDHSSLTRIHQRLPQEVHEAMFTFVLALAAEKKLLAGVTVAVDSTMLEANAAMKSIERKDTGEDWKEYLRRLAAAAGIENPTDEDLRRFDKKRTDKKVSNDDWQSPSDPDSRIAKMKDGRTHLAYKAEHVVDLKTDLVLAAVVYEANRGDAETLAESVVVAQKNIIAADSPANIQRAAADKGYHSAETLALLNGPLGVRTYIPEPQRKTRWKWRERPAEQRSAVTGNGRRVRGVRGKQLQRLRSELTERSFAHVCETGGARRSWLRGMIKVTKRYLLQVAARNLSLIMRKLFGMGTPRGLQAEGDASSLAYLIHALLATLWIVLRRASRALRSRAIVAHENRRRPPRLAPAA
jgi:hypothetical protein